MTRLTRLALGLVFLASPGLAQNEDGKDQDEQDQPPRFESEVRVEADAPSPPPSTAATRLPVPVRELPVSVAVVPEKVYEEQTALVLGDALKNASGVNVATGFGVFDFFTIRGFDSLTSGLVLTDGIVEPESTFYPLYNVRQVEVLKGPASFLYGGTPLAGAVQLVRRQPEPRSFGNATVSYGRYGTYEASFDGNASTSDGRLAFRLNATTQGTDGYRDLPDGSIWAVNPTLSWRPDNKTRLGLDFEYVRSEFPPDTGIPFVGFEDPVLAPVPRTTSYQSPLDRSEQDLYRFRFDFERVLGKGLTLRNRTYYTELDWLSDGTLIAGVLPGQDGSLNVLRSLVLLDDRQRLLGNQLELAAAFNTGSVRHDLLVGLELQSFKDRYTQDVALLAPVDLFDPVEPGVPPIPLPPLGQAGDTKSTVVAPYVIDRLHFSPKVQAFVGARLDALDYEDPLNDTNRDDTRVNPLVGLVFSPTESLGIHGSWGTASAPPSTQVIGPRDPEESQQAEIGAKLSFLDGAGFAGLSFYDLRRENIAIPDSSGITRQQGDQRSRGFEVDLGIKPVRGFGLTAAYAYTDAELTSFSEIVPLVPPDFIVVDRSGNVAPFAPKHLFNVWASQTFGSGLGLAVGLRHVGEQYTAEDNRTTIDPYTTLDAAVSFETKRWGVRVHFRNITDTEYETRGFGSASVIPARPFEARVRFRIGFGGL